MALTLRLSEMESKMLKRILPEFQTFSGKLKHMITSWEFHQNEINMLRMEIHDLKQQNEDYVAQLRQIRNALNVLKTISGKGF